MDAIDPIEQHEFDIAHFFFYAGVTRQACDDWLSRFKGGIFTPIPEQGNSSYSVYAGQDQEYIVQFRLKSISLDVDAINLAQKVYGFKVPTVVLEAQLGEDGGEKPPVLVYSIDRVRGTPYSSFLWYRDQAMITSREMNAVCRRNLTRDFARFFAMSWNSPRQLSSEKRAMSRKLQIGILEGLFYLPEEFHPIINACINQIDIVMRLPMVVYHTDLSKESFAVDNECQLVGIMSWSKLAIGPFGLNLYILQQIYGDFSLTYGRANFYDHEELQCLFWDTFSRSVGDLTDDEFRSIKMAMIMGFLQRWGLAWKVATYPGPEPASTVDEMAQFSMSILKSYLIDEKTRFEGIKELLEGDMVPTG
ncbi:hypothetical protein TASIC1_0001049800 [Trichoderma asperellum]|uniref:Aminoglycoside phosphotransferase domain-containing protein n=1 Tax=Trichoderma asperellum TaxID=101201 RepID=A0A6V8QKQ3_TRIAP|nr:hypothetical protein LI328DRAFT_141093 [Trichoderma asperelloides]GFP52346.1 hypothetical protein TASIC1_0001049800 [Trichoderma asperellum]